MPAEVVALPDLAEGKHAVFLGLAPAGHDAHGLVEAPAPGCHHILDVLDRATVVFRAEDQPVGDHFGQLGVENLFADAGYAAAQLAETPGLLVDFPQNGSFPFTADRVEGGAEAAGIGGMSLHGELQTG